MAKAKSVKPWVVYLIETVDGKIYTGITNDLEKRFRQHQKGSGAKFFRASPPLKIIYQETQPNRSIALKRELCIKKMTQRQKRLLSQSHSGT